MKKTETIYEELQRTISLTCDRCNREDYDIMEMQEYLHYNNRAGYGSVLGDGNIIEADICQHCVKEMFGSFLRVTGNYISGGDFLQDLSFADIQDNPNTYKKPNSKKVICPECLGVGIFGPPEDEVGCGRCLSEGRIYE